MFTKLLIANRGEIALRVIRACRELGIASVAVYSRRRRARAARARGRRSGAHRPRAVGRELPARRRASSRRRSASAPRRFIPATAFSPSASGSRARVRDAGLVFVGPPAEAIAAMGSKTAARQLAIARGRAGRARARPKRCATPPRRAAIAERFGYPGAAQGGGRRRREGDARRARRRRSSRRALDAARREAKNAFGDDAVYVEKYIDGPRHVEIQVLGDQHGTMLSLGERECSVQRRHQKMIEEAPSVAVTPELRRRMGETAVARRAGRRLRERRHVRVPARSRRRVLLPRDEHAASGRASRDRAGHGHRPRAVADPHRRRRAAAVRAGRHRAARLGDRVPHHERRPGERVPAVDRAHRVSARAERARACAGTAASRSGSEVGLLLRSDAREADRAARRRATRRSRACTARCSSSRSSASRRRASSTCA